MKKMNTLFYVIGIGAVLAFAYAYHRRKHPQPRTPRQALETLRGIDLKAEVVEQLTMLDCTAYFKSLNLRKGRDVPFIAQGDHPRVAAIFTHPQSGEYLLGTYNEETKEIENYKLIAPNSVDNAVLEALGNEPLVVLN